MNPIAFNVTAGRDPVEIRCARCGKAAVPAFSPGFLPGDCARLSDLLSWAQAHECPPASVT